MLEKPLFYVLLLITIAVMTGHKLEAADPPVNQEIRSGHSSSIAPWAQLAMRRNYSGGFVGGGAARRGEDRKQIQGTWGWDFHGLLPRKNSWLGWWNGRREQGGRGAYKTEGPRLINHGH
jgi:hypothetical protein